MECFLCSKFISETKQLWPHFKNKHNMKTEELLKGYRCTYGGTCSRTFYKFQHFLKHVKIHSFYKSPSNKNQKNSIAGSITKCEENTVHNSISECDACSENGVSDCDGDFDQPSEAELFSSRINEISNDFRKECVKIALQLHSKTNFSRKDVITIQNLYKPLLASMMTKFDNFVTEEFQMSTDKRSRFAAFSNALQDPFQLCETEHKLMNSLAEDDLVSNFEEFTINSEIGVHSTCGESTLGEKKSTGVLLPIDFQFRIFFERDDLLLKTIEKMNKISQSSHSFSNFIQGRLWQEKSRLHKQAGKIAIPFFLYIDETEINNPLGSHTGPIAFVYYSFPVVDYSPIDLACLFAAKDYKSFGNDKCLYRLISKIKSLEENGIAISTSEGVKTVHFILGLLLGDNLGLNTVLGFSSSFNSNFFCRFCKVRKCKKDCTCGKECTNFLATENTALLRDRANYDIDVLMADLSQTGVREVSIFNEIQSFHVTNNFAVDIMHDIFEGICNYDMSHIIDYLVNVKKFLSFKRLNVRKKMFNYGPIEITNISNDITPDHIKKFKLKMTASEMMSFVHHFPLMVGDLVPTHDEVWLFFVSFLELIDLLMCFDLSEDRRFRIKILVQNHNSEYVRIFKDSLKPKHHLTTHYSSVISQSGPPRTYWCFPFEKEHKGHKNYAHSITSRVNTSVSIAKKFQLTFANSLIQDTRSIYSFDSANILHNTQHIDLIKSFQSNMNFISEFKIYSNCTYYGKNYKSGYYLFVSHGGSISSSDSIKLFTIVEIVEIKSRELPYVVCKYVPIHSYNTHLAAYELNIDLTAPDSDQFCLYPIDYFSGPPINSHNVPNGKCFVRPIFF